MRHVAIGLILTYLCVVPVRASDEVLLDQLKTLHDRWFEAFDAGDGGAMDQIEVPTLVLVMPNGEIWHKTPRAGKQTAARNRHLLEDASVRTFGDTAILTGLLITKTNSSTSKEATTVVFVKGAGKWKIASAQWTGVSK